MRELNKLTGKNVAGEGALRAEIELEADLTRTERPGRASNLRSGKNFHAALATGGGATLR